MVGPDFLEFKAKMRNGRTTIQHSAKGSTWKEHKYIRKEKGRYIYPDKDVQKDRSKIPIISGKKVGELTIGDRDFLHPYVNEILKYGAETYGRRLTEEEKAIAIEQVDLIADSFSTPLPVGMSRIGYVQEQIEKEEERKKEIRTNEKLRRIRKEAEEKRREKDRLKEERVRKEKEMRRKSEEIKRKS